MLMTEQEQLAGYDDHGDDRIPELRALESPPSVPAASSPELRTLVAVVVGAVVVAALYVAQDVLIPMTLAVLLSFVLSPLVDLLRRIGLWRAPAVALSVLVALGAIGLIGTLLGSQATTLAADVPHYVEAVQNKLESIQAVATTRLAFITRILNGGRPAATPPTFPLSVRDGTTPTAGSSWRHAATTARRRTCRAELLGARGGSGRYRAAPRTARNHCHCADRCGVHSDAARGPARQVHTPRWLQGSASDDNRDGRCW